MVSFGCTGGQHRSVYLAEQLAKHLRGHDGVEVVVRHREQVQLNA
jgi:RNase adaptor protein for sRNA GlmZ degradation